MPRTATLRRVVAGLLLGGLILSAYFAFYDHRAKEDNRRLERQHERAMERVKRGLPPFPPTFPNDE